MKLVYGKELDGAQFKKAADIAFSCDISIDTARLLLYRDIDTVAKAKAFLSPGKSHFNNPFLLDGMGDAVARIKTAKERGENVLVFGDYDADGVCASTVLYYSLKDFGINPRVFVPERDENYGLNVSTVSNLNAEKKIDLLITVDCGISDGEKIEELKNMGIDVVVTDHHEPPEILPDCICINPKIKGQQYPFEGLCGAGVAYKLSYALINEKADAYLDFVALATVADSMDLLDENRDIVVEGLKLFNNPNTLRLPFKYLLGDNNRQVTAQTFMYSIAPRVNAGGRMGDAKCSLNLFLEKDPNKVFDLATKLNEYNLARQVECDSIYKQAKEIIHSEQLDKNNIILVGSETWRVGFVGIVAARLVEDFARPVIVFAGQDGYFKGSARSVDGVNIFDALTAVKDVLITYGGHSQAAGVAVEKVNFNLLSDKLNEYVGRLVSNDQQEKTFFVDLNLTSPVSIKFAKEIDELEPFGVGNRRPLFSVTAESISSIPLKSGSAHYSFKTDVIDMLDFNGERNVIPLSLPVRKTILFEVNLSSYKNRESVKGYVRNVCLDLNDITPLKPYVFAQLLKELLGETEKPEWCLNEQVSALSLKDFMSEISTDRQDFISVFTALKFLDGQAFIDVSSFVKKHFEEESVIQAILVTEVFLELGIFTVKNGYFYYQEKIKNALTNSALYSKINSLRENYVRDI